jgi:hypothetical protein
MLNLHARNLRCASRCMLRYWHQKMIKGGRYWHQKERAVNILLNVSLLYLPFALIAERQDAICTTVQKLYWHCIWS